MLFIISKLSETLLLPSNDIAGFAITGVLAYALGRRRVGLALPTISTLLLIVAVGFGPRHGT
ncbi:hypothetical protein AU467_25915 [Mesorhizobium loti]|uniref:Uncharacterized protein n=1 Tax=Rhizobium loti TaxID=381 RepID=A0A101KRK9_RHILI|nr:hypothetical protein AU467_25915 [Mesorhizobium loti]